MAKRQETEKWKKQWRHKLMTLVGCVTHTQVVADQAIELAGKFMRYDEMDENDAVRVIENLSCACEEALEVLFNEIKTDNDEKGND